MRLYVLLFFFVCVAIPSHAHSVEFNKVENTWDKHSKIKPYNARTNAVNPLDPAYSTTINPPKQKKSYTRTNTKTNTKQKKQEKPVTVVKSEAKNEQKPTSTISHTSSTPNNTETPLQVKTNINTEPFDAKNIIGEKQNINTQNVKEETRDKTLQILRTEDNTLEALKELYGEDEKLRDEVVQLRLRQEETLKQELNLPKPEYVDIIN